MLCAITILQIYKKWETNPVLVTLAEKATPISQIPFPAVTVCPMTKLNKQVINFTELCQMFKNN
jgi:acid-sensing ion channel, other